MIILLTTLILLVEISIEACAKGCLKCDFMGNCLVCDPTNMYYLDKSGCRQTNTTNCLMANQIGGCLQCRPNFYVDPNTQNCLIISTPKMIPKCLIYSSKQECILCAEKHTLANKQCVEVITEISNCLTYETTVTCLKCKDNMIPSADKKQCVNLSRKLNCLDYTYVKCGECKRGYFKDENNYFYEFDTPGYLYSKIVDSKNEGRNPLKQFSVCRALNVTNCQLFSSFDVCIKCEKGYYLADKKCLLFPSPVIPNCKVYSSLNACSECQMGWFLKNSILCQINEKITNCKAYNGSSPMTNCLECSEDYFLEENSCKERIQSLRIPNCQTVSSKSDTCQKCQSSYILTSDSSKCMREIPNCMMHGPSSNETMFLSCNVCQNGYYLVSSVYFTECQIGNIENCLLYEIGRNRCKVCLNGHYLNNGLCPSHIKISNCILYHSTTPNTCDSCVGGSYSFRLKTVCFAVKSIPNCELYTDDGITCTKCAFTYYLTNNECLPIPTTVPNCILYSGQDCIKCAKGHMLNSLTEFLMPSCDKPFSYVTRYCNTTDNDASVVYTWRAAGASPIRCLSCRNYTVTLTPTNTEAICVSNSQGSLFQMGSPFLTVPNCYRFGINYATPSSVVCMECVKDYFIVGYWPSVRLTGTTSTIACQLGCDVTTTPLTNSLFVDDLMGTVNVCACMKTPGDSACILNDNCSVHAKLTHFQSKANSATVANAMSDWGCVRSASTHMLHYALPTTQIPFDRTPTVQTSLTQAAYSSHGLFINETSYVPSVFNLRSFKMTTVLIPSPGVGVNTLSFCEISYLPLSGKGTSNFPTTASQCLRCRFALFTLFSATSTSSTDYPTCVAISACTSYKLGGLPAFWNQVFSCHFCANNGGLGLYPKVHVEYGETNTPAADSNNFYQFMVRTSGTKLLFECAPALDVIPTSSSDLVSGLTAMTSCGAYAVGLPVSNNAATDPSIPMCIACKTGFYPTHNDQSSAVNRLPIWAVSACTPVSNCNSTITVGSYNGCDACILPTNISGVISYHAFTDFLMWDCQRSTTDNCFILDWSVAVVPGTPHPCLVCRHGFVLNADNQCEQHVIPNQRFGAVFSNAVHSNYYLRNSNNPPNESHYVRMHYLLSYFGGLYGVYGPDQSACEESHVLIPPSPMEPFVCVESPYLRSGLFVSSGSKFVPKCVGYSNPSVPLSSPTVLPCVVCEDAYIPTNDRTSCVNALRNCTFAKNSPETSLCHECNKGWLNWNGACVSPSIANCANYQNTERSFGMTSVVCLACLNGYSLDSTGSVCSRGSVKNCEVYLVNSTDVCLGCESGYGLVGLSGGKSHCLFILNSTNALSSFVGNSLSDGADNSTFVATKCSQSGGTVFGVRLFESLPMADMVRSVCIPLRPVANCKTYDQDSTTLGKNTLECTLCNDGFYLRETDLCAMRTAKSKNCVQFSPRLDVCLKCSSGFFVSQNGTECLQFPTGIFGCVVYSSASECVQCQAPLYADNNVCKESVPIDKCQIYSKNNSCVACEATHFLSSPTQCTPATAQNCLTFSSPSACETCPSNFGLQQDSNAVNCVSNKISQCVKSSDQYPFKCLQCELNHYPDEEGGCVTVSNPIRHCLVHDKSDLCSKCQSDSVLSSDGKTCETSMFGDMIDPNCVHSFVVTEAVCSTCAFGFYYTKDGCVECSENSIESGCLSCDPKDLSKCLVCAPGFYQPLMGSCEKSESVDGDVNNTSSGNKTNSTTKNTIFIFKITAINSLALIFCSI